MFQTVRVRTELVDIGLYREQMMAVYGSKGFKKAVAEDLERRRDLHCPVEPHTDSPERDSGTLHASK
jgi:hypothetical protein